MNNIPKATAIAAAAFLIWSGSPWWGLLFFVAGYVEIKRKGGL